MSGKPQWFVSAGGAVDLVRRKGDSVQVVRGAGYTQPGSVALELQDTGNGYIARFPAGSSVEQDYYVCLDYSQARNLVLALAPFKEDLGFANAAMNGGPAGAENNPGGRGPSVR